MTTQQAFPRASLLLILALAAALLPPPAPAACQRELALDAGADGPLHRQDFRSYTLVLHLPLGALDRSGRARLLLGATLGGLRGGGEESTLAAAGPGLDYALGRRLRLRYDLQGAWLGDHVLAGRDLGGPFQFLHRLTLVAAVGRRAVAAAGLWHMSNAGLYDANPGLSGFLLELGVRY